MYIAILSAILSIFRWKTIAGNVFLLSLCAGLVVIDFSCLVYVSQDLKFTKCLFSVNFIVCLATINFESASISSSQFNP